MCFRVEFSTVILFVLNLHIVGLFTVNLLALRFLRWIHQFTIQLLCGVHKVIRIFLKRKIIKTLKNFVSVSDGLVVYHNEALVFLQVLRRACLKTMLYPRYKTRFYCVVRGKHIERCYAGVGWLRAPCRRFVQLYCTFCIHADNKAPILLLGLNLSLGFLFPKINNSDYA